MESSPDAGSFSRPCKRCKVREATLTSRAQAVCSECFSKQVSTKFIKQLSALGKQVSTTIGIEATRKFLIGLSLGHSSSVLVDLVHGYVRHLAENGRKPAFDVTVVYVDQSLDEVAVPPFTPESTGTKVLQRYRERYPLFNFERIPLTAVLGLSTIDWTSLPDRDEDKPPTEQIKTLLNRLPSMTSKADILRLFIRHILVSLAVERGSHALIFGHSTTAIAELTLAETAKGRGFSLPWQTNDGPFTTRCTRGSDAGAEDPTSKGDVVGHVLIYHPLRDSLRKELVTYAAALTSPPLTEIIPGDPEERRSSVVSHKDLSIEEVMMRYFAEVEENYPSVVANVARTTSKLERLGSDDERCAICAMPLDDLGDERWRGEVGDDDRDRDQQSRRICYGCKRSVHS